MTFIKKQSAGFYLNVLAIILGIIGLVRYFANCKTAYFSNLGTDTKVIVALILGIIALAVFVAGYEVLGNKILLDVCPVVAAMAFTVATIVFVSTRVNGIAAIMTFNNNASTMADLNHTITSIVFCAAAMLLTIIGSFFKIVKED